MPKVAIGGKLHPGGLEVLSSTPGITLDYTEEVSTESLMPMLLEADALLIRTQKLPRDFIDQAKNLKIVSRHGVGFDAVDVAALNKRGIPLAIVGDVNSQTVAEHAMTLILAVTKRLLRYDAASRGNREWNYRNSLEAEELANKTLLIIGYGRIGKHLARMAQVFGMSVSVFDPYYQPDLRPAASQSADSLSDDAIKSEPDLASALSCADVVSVHVPATEKPVIGASELALLKPSSIVINTARGGVINEKALIDALDSAQIAGAGIDVFSTEPPLPDHPLANFDQVILTPHSAGMTRQCAERMAISSATNIVKFFNNTLDTSLVVNAREINYKPRAAQTSEI
ncbi:3-phosphoglycerate dehydrogenase [Chromatiales bacterium (ex Bugula neritina AB1)]|nr:3-phosphoglycerate dehydrogenase [Chromatiales bacterium (ex Bugula neritina AB1)]